MRGSRQGPADASCVRPGGRGVACESAQFFSPGSAPAKNALSRGAVAARQQGPNSQFCVVNAPPRLSEKSQNFLKVCLRHTGLPPLPAAGFGPGPCGAGGPGMQAPAGPAFQDPGTLFGAARSRVLLTCSRSVIYHVRTLMNCRFRRPLQGTSRDLANELERIRRSHPRRSPIPPSQLQSLQSLPIPRHV